MPPVQISMGNKTSSRPDFQGTFKQINLRDIDICDERYRISREKTDVKYLARSIRQNGLFHPPSVRRNKDRYIIVSGFKRITAFSYNWAWLNTETVPVYEIKPDLPEYQYVIHSITSVAFQRSLTSAELVIGLKKLQDFFPLEHIAKKSTGIFNSQINLNLITDLLEIGSLPDTCLDLLHEGKISLKLAKNLTGLPEPLIDLFLQIFTRINASRNKQFEIVQNLTEILKRENIRIRDFCEEAQFQEILYDPQTDTNKKTQLLRRYLYARRYPALSRAKEKIRSAIAGIRLGNKIRLTPPENFESSAYSISFSADSYDEFKKTVDQLEKSAADENLKKLFNLDL